MCFRPSDVELAQNKCSACKTVNPQEATVCSECGAELAGVKALESAGPDLSRLSTGGVPKPPPAPPKAPPLAPKV